MKAVFVMSLLFTVWAKNHRVGAVDAVEDVRRMRKVDTARSMWKWDRVAAAATADGRSEQEIEKALLAQLGFPP